MEKNCGDKEIAIQTIKRVCYVEEFYRVIKKNFYLGWF